VAQEALGLNSVTGLPNHRYMLHELARHTEFYKRHRHPFTLLLVRFENVTEGKDAWGEPTGEATLAYLASLVQTHVRTTDICCHCAEDAFAVIMPQTNKQYGETLAWRIAQSVVPKTFKIGEALVGVRVSFGTASCPRDGVEAEALLQAARIHKAT
jgi:diguanylate cyclase (GGDEF)-like protein